MNAPILNALDNDETKRIMMHNCVEEELGYDSPNSDKPYCAYKFVKDWTDWSMVPENWKKIMRVIFSEYAESLQ